MGGFSQRIYKRERCKHEDGRRSSAGGNLLCLPTRRRLNWDQLHVHPPHITAGKNMLRFELGKFFFFFFVSSGSAWLAVGDVRELAACWASSRV